MDSAASPTLKEIFRDKDIGVAAIDISSGHVVIHSEVFGKLDRRKIEQVQEVNTLIDEALRGKGITKIYTWAVTDEQYKWNQFLGFTPTGKEVILDTSDQPDIEYPTIYEFEKAL